MMAIATRRGTEPARHMLLGHVLVSRHRMPYWRRPYRHRPNACAKTLFCGLTRGPVLDCGLGLQLRRLLLDLLDDVVDHLVIRHRMALLAGEIDHAAPCPATGETDIGHQRLARPVHHAANDRERHRRLDVLEALFKDADRLDDVETLPRA